MSYDSSYSMGTAPVLNSIHTLISQENPIDTIIINVDTLVRNCCRIDNNVDITVNINNLVNTTRTEILTILEDICEMFRMNLAKIINPTIILYLGKYAPYLPQHLRRPSTYYKSCVYQVSSIINQSVSDKLIEINRGIQIVQLPQYNVLPYKTLINEIQNLQNQHRVAIISHHPLDYHIEKACSMFYVVQSFTGSILRHDQLGKKVFITDVFPFNLILHTILGDKEDFICSLSRKEKAALINIAKKESWVTLPNDEVTKRCYDIGLSIPFSI